MEIVEQYLQGLRQALPEEPREELALASGASAEQLQALQQAYPLCPASLLALLGQINGSHWQEYDAGTVSVLMLGADAGMNGYPYYLRSVEQILEDRERGSDSIADTYSENGRIDPNWLTLDPRIDAKVSESTRLCFAHCMNNGGTSMLYVDFVPGEGGVVGQIVRYVHDPDEFCVIADDFDAYLQLVMARGYEFVDEDD